MKRSINGIIGQGKVIGANAGDRPVARTGTLTMSLAVAAPILRQQLEATDAPFVYAGPVLVGRERIQETFPVVLSSVNIDGKTVRIRFESSGEIKAMR